MITTHLWAGHVPSREIFEAYLDQKVYLKAWAKYDHEPPTGNPEADAEPSPNLRCQFCKDAGIDFYDEDKIVFNYYHHPVGIDTISKNILVDATQLGELFKKNKLENCNAVIAYYEKNLKLKKPSHPSLLKYMGKLHDPETSTGLKTGLSHYLWTGDAKLSKAEIIKGTGLKNTEIGNLKFCYSKEKKKLEEILILEVHDYDLAERMILKVDSMNISQTVKAVLILSLNNGLEINIHQISTALNLDFLAEFHAR